MKDIKPNAQAKKIVTLKDKLNLDNQGIILINDSSMQEILKKSGKLAKDNEYQVHFWSLVLRHKAQDNSILDICIPTAFFNYKQEVSGASIDFELTDVEEVSDKVLPIHNMKATELLSGSLLEDIESYMGLRFEVFGASLSSCHKHPSTSLSQAFSSTDLSRNHKDLGVVYPLGTATDDQPNFALIMINKTSSNSMVAHAEYRIVNGTFKEDIVYEQGRCAALISKPKTLPSSISALFGAEPIDNNYNALKNCTNNRIFDEIQYVFETQGFEASTDAICEDNIVEQHTAWKKPKGLKKPTIYRSATKVEYIEALAEVEKYKDYVTIAALTLGTMPMAQLQIEYARAYTIYFGRNVTIKEACLDMSKDDILFEIMAVQEDIESDCEEALELIMEYEMSSEAPQQAYQDHLDLYRY